MTEQANGEPNFLIGPTRGCAKNSAELFFMDGAFTPAINSKLNRLSGPNFKKKRGMPSFSASKQGI